MEGRHAIAQTRVLAGGAMMLMLLLASASSCEKLTKSFTREPMPNLGPQLPISARIEFDPSVATASAPFVDSCGHPTELRVGPDLQDALLQSAYATFKTVYEGASSGDKPDVEVRIKLLKPLLTIKSDALYDRAPAELRLDALAEFRDSSGQRLAEKELQVVRQQRLQVELTQSRCAYVTDPFVSDAAVALATKFSREARALFDPASRASTPAGAAQTPASAPTASSGLTFKAVLLDENANGILEGGERVRIRVEVANIGTIPAQDVAVRVAGLPAVVSQFPSPILPVGLLQPGESRSVEFSGTVPQSVQGQNGELTISLTETSRANLPPPQTLRTVIGRGSRPPR
jgi:hypothetical protein